MKTVNPLTTTLLAVLLLVNLTAGCGTTIRSQVKASHKLPRTGVGGGTFVIRPKYEALPNSLEFQSYADRVVRNLEVHGYRLAKASGALPDYEVVLDYGVNEDASGYSGSPPGFGAGSPYAWGSGGVTGGHQNVPTAPAVLSTVPSYEIYLTIEIRGHQSPASSSLQPQTLYEGRAVNRGWTRDSALVLPTLIEALFQDFPGESGQSGTVLLKPVEE